MICSSPIRPDADTASQLSEPRKLAVIGAGIIGLSVAIKLLEVLGDKITIEVIAESFLDGTTSYNCGGLWEPYEVGGCSEADVIRWSEQTLQHFLDLNFLCPGKSGVQLLSSFTLFNSDVAEIPFWSVCARGFQALSADELKQLRVPPEFKSGYKYDTVVVDQSYYLKYLMGLLTASGRVTFVQRQICSLEELLHEKCEYEGVIVCAGLNAKGLCDDSSVVPIRGQVLRVR
jgi:glycine/D-amino acid oxidase-like deaminating enzyme